VMRRRIPSAWSSRGVMTASWPQVRDRAALFYSAGDALSIPARFR
jgi:hypothetical protein